MTESSRSLWDQTLRRVRKVWPGSQRGALKERVSEDLTDSDAERLRQQIDACLEAHGGEVSARARAAELGVVPSLHTSAVATKAEPLGTEGGAASEWTTRSDAYPIPIGGATARLLDSMSSATPASSSTIAPRKYATNVPRSAG